MAQHIVVVEYDPQWALMFEAEAALIQDILQDNLVEIHHIGSTAVEGLFAKPIIDIMPVVKSLEAVDAVSSKFEEIGYEYLGEFGIQNRRYLRKGGDERTHQIHMFPQSETDHINRHLAFRDYMRTHPKEREQYSNLKRELARRFPYDIDGYCKGKEAFVARIEAKAISSD